MYYETFDENWSEVGEDPPKVTTNCSQTLGCQWSAVSDKATPLFVGNHCVEERVPSGEIPMGCPIVIGRAATA
jgi:hypothetical protein